MALAGTKLVAVDMRTHALQVMAIERREREKAEALEAVEQEELLRAAANKKKADDETREKATKVSLHRAIRGQSGNARCTQTDGHPA